MHTEHLQNVRVAWVVTGWLIAIAVTSLIVLVLAALGLVHAEGDAGAVWTLAAVALGFWAGGFAIGFRALEAPVLHGVGMGLTSLVAWFLLNLLATLLLQVSWQGLSPTLTAALLLVQMAGAIGGAWTGHNIALRGGTGMPDELLGNGDRG